MTYVEHDVLPCPHCKQNPKPWRQWFKSTATGWGHPRHAPYGRWSNFYPRGEYMVRHRPWLDHLYRLRRHDGTVVYVAEPYNLEGGDIADIEQLRQDGWRVTVDGCGAHHETTIRILINRVKEVAP